MSDLRFTPGETYAFLRTRFEMVKPRFGRLYIPWEDKFIANDIVVLTCFEHHRVAWNQDPEGKKEYDGFTFKDAEGNLWANQWPTASYGQLDDSSDRIVRRHFETSELLEIDEHGKPIEGEDGRYTRKDPELWRIFEDSMDNPYTLATTFMDTVYRAIHPYKFVLEKHRFTEVQIKCFQDYLNGLIKLTEEATGKQVEFKPVVLNFTDGKPSETLEDYKVAELV